MATINTGYQGIKILQQRYADDNSLTGLQMPNIAMISPQSIVPNTAAITFNYPNDVAPTGGSNGDVWYNFEANELFKKISGTWTLLTDRVTNDAYIDPVINEEACPIDEPDAQIVEAFADTYTTIVNIDVKTGETVVANITDVEAGTSGYASVEEGIYDVEVTATATSPLAISTTVNGSTLTGASGATLVFSSVTAPISVYTTAI